jgi:hypothetical protein
MNWLIAKLKGAWAFGLAALTAPLSYVLTGPCTSVGCGACPLGGACLISLPLLFGGVVFAKGFRRFKERLGRLGRNNYGADHIITIEGEDS